MEVNYDILGLGAIAVDDLLYADSYPAAGEKIRLQRTERRCGGQTGTALVAAARLGCRCTYGGYLGSDPLSQEVVRKYGEEGIDTSQRADADFPSPPAHSTIIIAADDASRTIFSKVPDNFGAHPGLPDEKIIQSSRVLLIDHHGLEGNLRAAKIARAAGRAVIADFERYTGPDMDLLIELVDHLIVPHEFAAEITGQGDPSRAATALADLRRTVIITLGEEGCVYVPPGESACSHLPAFMVDAIDTTGCGDVFHGGYAAGLCQGLELVDRLILASAVAAIKASRPGGGEATPTTEELTDFLDIRGVDLYRAG